MTYHEGPQQSSIEWKTFEKVAVKLVFCFQCISTFAVQGGRIFMKIPYLVNYLVVYLYYVFQKPVDIFSGTGSASKHVPINTTSI